MTAVSESSMSFPAKVNHHLRFRAWQYTQYFLNASAPRYWDRRVKQISAMMRVKNEEEFLAASVLSIADFVDEIVIIDNLSTDNTPSGC